MSRHARANELPDWAVPVLVGVIIFGVVGAAVAASGPALPAWRRKMLACARDHVAKGTLYQWGGGRDPAHDWGVDCSGLVIDCARKTGFDASGWGSQRMWAELPHLTVPQPADLALYSPRHVVMVESYNAKTGIATIIGSNGGDSSTTTPEMARAQNAFVRRAPTQFYRDGFLGFATLVPLVEAKGLPIE